MHTQQILVSLKNETEKKIQVERKNLERNVCVQNFYKLGRFLLKILLHIETFVPADSLP